jgi:hypothetical protein
LLPLVTGRAFAAARSAGLVLAKCFLKFESESLSLGQFPFRKPRGKFGERRGIEMAMERTWNFDREVCNLEILMIIKSIVKPTLLCLESYHGITSRAKTLQDVICKTIYGQPENNIW